MYIEMLNEVLNYDVATFIDTFGNDTGELLELIYERYFDNKCELKAYYRTRYDLKTNKVYDNLEIVCYKFVAGEIEHVAVDFDLSDYYNTDVDNFLRYANKKVYDKFDSVRERAYALTDENIADYILPRKESEE